MTDKEDNTNKTSSTLIHLLNGDCFEFENTKQEDVMIAMSNELHIATNRMKLVRKEEVEKEEDNNTTHYFLVITDSPDYPFTDFATYYKALTSSLMDPHSIDKKYPRYNEMLDNVSKADSIILLELLDLTNDPQTGFDGLVRALVRGYRYANDLLPFIVEVIDEMFRRGARFTDSLCEFIAHGRGAHPNEFEDDMGRRIQVKASLLHFAKRNDHDWMLWKTHVPEWETIAPMHWEDMMQWRWPCHLLPEHMPYGDAYRRALKFEFENNPPVVPRGLEEW